MYSLAFYTILIFALMSYESKKIVLLPIYFSILLVSGTVIFGYRSGGIDYFGYLEIFNDVGASNHNNAVLYSGREPLFLYLNSLAVSLNLSFSGFLAMIFFISVAIKFFVIIRCGTKFFVGAAIFFALMFEQEVGQIRNALATSLIMLTNMFLIEKKKGFAYLSSIAAISTHFSAIVFIPFILYFQHYKIRQYKLPLIACLIMGPLLGIATNFVLLLLNLIGFGSISSIISNYLYISGSSEFGIFYGIYLILIFIIFRLNRLIENDYGEIFFKCFFYGVCLTLLFWDSVVVSGRMFEMFCESSLIIIISRMVNFFHISNRPLVINVALLFCLIKFQTAVPNWEDTCVRVWSRCDDAYRVYN